MDAHVPWLSPGWKSQATALFSRGGRDGKPGSCVTALITLSLERRENSRLGLGRPQYRGGHPRWPIPPCLTLSVEKTLFPWGLRGWPRTGSLEWRPRGIEWPPEFRKPREAHEGVQGVRINLLSSDSQFTQPGHQLTKGHR